MSLRATFFAYWKTVFRSLFYPSDANERPGIIKSFRSNINTKGIFLQCHTSLANTVHRLYYKLFMICRGTSDHILIQKRMAVSLQTDNPIQAGFLDHFSCKICLEILTKPVQCQRNEHYFCTVCITTHLQTSQTCPVCQEELTLETLRPLPRVVADLLMQFEAPRCKYIQRGCTKVIEQQELPFHHQVCGFAPVVCSNEGCGETVNKQDQVNHEKESCPLRKTKCEVCKEEMVHRDHEKHTCVLRKEVDDLKACFLEISSCLKEIQAEVKAHSESIKNLQDPLRKASSSVIHQERRFIVNGQIVVAGGNDGKTKRSYEVFNWSTKSWTLFEDALFFEHSYSFSFPYNNNIMICGGTDSNYGSKRIERLDLNSATSIASPSSLPNYSGKGVLCGNDIRTFGRSVSQTRLEPPYSTHVMVTYERGQCRQYYGAANVQESVAIVGGTKQNSWATDEVKLYNPVTNELKQLAPLPYKVSHMATVPYKDNIIILGGQEDTSTSLNSVIMYNITNQECKMLPSMLEKRSGCTAVIMGKMIVVMGGRTKLTSVTYLNTVEYLVLGEDTWKELPSMHCAREGATASVQI